MLVTPPLAVTAVQGVGIGLRQPHYRALFERRPSLAFIEVHSENFFADGGAALAVLRDARALYPVSLHGVGLGLGSAAGIDGWHLDRLERLVETIEPARVSDHAAFARVMQADGSTAHANDLLPLAFTEAALEILVANVGAVQDRLKRPILVENLSQYVTFADDAIAEPDFLAQLCRRSGCGLLLDVNNLMVNALNASRGRNALGPIDELRLIDAAHPLDATRPVSAAVDAEPHASRNVLQRCRDFIDALPLGIVGEIHLAGYADTRELVIDDHGSRVRTDVWTLFEHAIRRFGAVPTLIEWDTDMPALDVLLDEADHAARLIAAHADRAAVERLAGESPS